LITFVNLILVKMLFILLLFSCAHEDEGKSRAKYEFNSVETSEDESFSKIEISSSKLWKDSTIERISGKKKDERIVIALSFSPSLYATPLYLGFYKALKEKKFKVHMLSASNFSIIIALLLAEDIKIKKIEWGFIQLFSEVSLKGCFYTIKATS